MGRFRKITSVPLYRGKIRIALSWLFFCALGASHLSAVSMDDLRGVYFPAECLSGRSFQGIVHYMEAAGMSLAVLHAKDPRGRLFWESGNTTAKAIGAVARRTPLKRAVAYLKQRGIWTAAKLDVFQDSLLVTEYPELGVADTRTGGLWADRKGLHWANPHDERVWEYNIALCLELIDLGFDEIQFDYIRFPSDGDLSTIDYPVTLPDTSRDECIGRFLAHANARLKPAGVTISIDVFGMTAWKTGDFGVGQVLEKIAPHVDVICPMLYPSHFPENFLSLENPGKYPHKIMKRSLEEMRRRTDRPIRPWVQGFWYAPDEIDAQIRGITETEIRSWTVWSPSGGYLPTFTALENRSGKKFPLPDFYPGLEALREREDSIQSGRSKLINLTSYRDGFSILSLDETIEGRPNPHGTIMDITRTLDESIADRILTVRGLKVNIFTNPYTKAARIAELIIQDLEVDPRRMRPAPIYIDWDGGCVFTREIPDERLDSYRSYQIDRPSR